ncbi:MAG: glutamate racemase [Chloroflexota bacterium]|nr:glutamate racemase [Chloroflexota bacterium]
METINQPQQPIGIFDSGVGGVSVLRAIRHELPNEAILYIGDQAHIPYGPRTKAQIRDFATTITRFLLDQGAKLIVVACNTASAAALHDLRILFPEIAFVGMEPAVKPAAEATQTGKVGVLATPTTFAGDLYASVVERFAKDVYLFTNTCPGLVEQIEAGALDAPETHAILEEALLPMLAEGIDTIVMGCTHYPFVIPLIQAITGPEVRTIDPAPAVARQTRRLLEQQDLLNPIEKPGQLQFYTSADPVPFSSFLPVLLGDAGPVTRVTWDQDQSLHVVPPENK